MSEIYAFSQHIFQNRAYRLTFFWLFEDTPTRNHPFSSQNERQQQNIHSGASSFCLDRTQIYMKSEHLAEAKRKGRSRGLPTIINYKDTIHSTTTTTTTTIILKSLTTHRHVSLTALDYSPLLWGNFLNNITIGFPHTPKPSPMTSGHHTSWSSDMKDNYSLVYLFLENHKVCECCPKTNQSPQKHHIQTKKMCPKCISVVWKTHLTSKRHIWTNTDIHKNWWFYYTSYLKHHMTTHRMCERCLRKSICHGLSPSTYIFRKHKVCECCPKTTQSHLKHHI